MVSSCLPLVSSLNPQQDALGLDMDPGRTTTTSKTKKRKPLKSLPLAVCQKKKRTGLSRSVPQLAQQVEQSGNDSEGISSKVVADSDFSGPAFLFEDVKRFEDFHIQINGLCLDSELPEHLRMKYYELCRYRNEFLHVGLIPGLYSKLAAGIIGETVNIADAIRACKLTTFLSEFAVWEKSLKSFELLGMNVEFLHNRMGRLLSISIDARGVSDAQREAKSEQTRIVNEIKNLEAKVLELKGASEKFDALQSKVEEYELKFQEEANAPW
ncbi:hypothetical protein RJ639_011702 [Escallonia herrerae]|uniref:Uncharacterized protein n=1 Tax=Escallonia herrerae TaxID=1293975 RepID=A0AA88VLV3_9ASTE|nr:hypothetical protein RJ639_011702 [Escallonia herrerae]